MDHDHSMMDHSMMDHNVHPMNHSAMNHSTIDHSTMEHSAMDHSLMDHSMGHSANHSMMNHSVMDRADMMHHHSEMDHSGMDHSGMAMTFHFGVSERVLFDGWEVKSVSTMLLSCIGIFFMAAIYEGIKYYRENLLWKTYNSLHYRAVDENAVPDADNHKTPKMFSKKHILQTGLHIVQLTVSYLLMLIFMTYNVWLCLAVVVGSAVGYFMFGWKRTVVVDMTETCH